MSEKLLALVGTVSMIISIKNNEDRYMSFEQGYHLCQGAYELEMF